MVQDRISTSPSTQDWLLMRYAAGRLPPYESMMMAAYVALSAAARRRLAAYEAACARMMVEKVTPVDVTRQCLDNILAVIAAPGAARPKNQTPPPAPADATGLPPAVIELLCRHCPPHVLAWENAGHGISKIDLRLCQSEPRRRRLRLMRLAPHQFTPHHRHQGREITLVLHGSYSDETGHYHPGDLIVLDDPGLAHTPRAGAEGCICLILTEAPLRFENPLIQLMNLFRPL